MWRGHQHQRKSKFHLWPLWKIIKLGFVRSPSLVQQKCQLLTPHTFASRVPSLLTEIEISRSAIMKNDKIWVLCVPRQSYSKSVNYWPPTSLGQGFHRCWRKSKFLARPLWKMTKLGFVHSRHSYSKSVNYRPPISLGQGFHCCWQKSKFPALPFWKMTKLGFVRSPSLVQQKCQLPTPHKCGSRVPSLLTEIEISRSAIMKNDKIGFCAFPVARIAKVSITDPPQVWVKGSIVVNGNWNFLLGHFEKWQNWVLCVPRRSYSKSVNYRPPISLGQGFHRCWRKSKFPARPLWKMTKLGFVRSPSLVQQKCQLLTPHKFGSRVPSLLTEIEISRSAIMKNDKIGFCAFPVARTAKVSISDPP